jgi:hypothetical protein
VSLCTQFAPLPVSILCSSYTHRGILKLHHQQVVAKSFLLLVIPFEEHQTWTSNAPPKHEEVDRASGKVEQVLLDANVENNLLTGDFAAILARLAMSYLSFPRYASW